MMMIYPAIKWVQSRNSSSPHRYQVAAGEVEIQGGIYDLETGHVEFLGQSPAQEPWMEMLIGQWIIGKHIQGLVDEAI